MAPRMKVETSESQPASQSSSASAAASHSQTARVSSSVSAPKPQVSTPRPSVESSKQSGAHTAPAQKAVAPRVVPSVEAPAAESSYRPGSSVPARPPRHVAVKASVDISSVPEVAERRSAPAPKHSAASKPTVNVQHHAASGGNRAERSDEWDYGEATQLSDAGDFSRTSASGSDGVHEGAASQGGAAQSGQQTAKSKASQNFIQMFSAWVHRTFPGHEHAFMGGVVAFFVAILMIVIGPLYSIVIFLVVLVGVAIGQYLDGDPKIVRMVSGLFNGDRDQR